MIDTGTNLPIEEKSTSSYLQRKSPVLFVS